MHCVKVWQDIAAVEPRTSHHVLRRSGDVPTRAHECLHSCTCARFMCVHARTCKHDHCKTSFKRNKVKSKKARCAKGTLQLLEPNIVCWCVLCRRARNLTTFQGWGNTERGITVVDASHCEMCLGGLLLHVAACSQRAHHGGANKFQITVGLTNSKSARDAASENRHWDKDKLIAACAKSHTGWTRQMALSGALCGAH